MKSKLMSMFFLLFIIYILFLPFSSYSKALRMIHFERILLDNQEKPTAILIDTYDRKLFLLSDQKILKEYPVAVGKIETPTPQGDFKVISKQKWGNGFGTRWLGLNVPWGIYGIHGTNKPWSIGGHQSAGCIRMHNSHVEEMYDLIDIGIPVKIIGGPYGPFTYGKKTLFSGSKGSQVVEVQKRLKNMGYYEGNIDGIFGWSMEKAVKDFQKNKGLKVTGQIRDNEYEELGIILFE